MEQDNFVDSEDSSDEMNDAQFVFDEENLSSDADNLFNDCSYSDRCKVDLEKGEKTKQSNTGPGITIDVNENGDMLFSPYQPNNINLYINDIGDMVISAPHEDLDIFVAATGDMLITSSLDEVQDVEIIIMDLYSKMTILHGKGISTQKEDISSPLPTVLAAKFEHAIAALPILPHYQDLTSWNVVMDWSDLLQPDQLGQMLAQSFFPRWLHVLSEWLDTAPNDEDVVVWYSRWKSSFPITVLHLPCVANDLALAHQMMDRVNRSKISLASKHVELQHGKL